MVLTSFCRNVDSSRVTAISPAVHPPSAPLSAALLIQRIGAVFSGMPDTRGKSNNPRYALEDAVLAAFSIFFTQSPSFLDSQVWSRPGRKTGWRWPHNLFSRRTVMTNRTASWPHPVAGLISGVLTMPHGASPIWVTICTAPRRIMCGCLDKTPTFCLLASQSRTPPCMNGSLTSRGRVA